MVTGLPTVTTKVVIVRALGSTEEPCLSKACLHWVKDLLTLSKLTVCISSASLRTMAWSLGPVEDRVHSNYKCTLPLKASSLVFSKGVVMAPRHTLSRPGTGVFLLFPCSWFSCLLSSIALNSLPPKCRKQTSYLMMSEIPLIIILN